jgi:hypothetical protein
MEKVSAFDVKPLSQQEQEEEEEEEEEEGMSFETATTYCASATYIVDQIR